MLTRRRFSFVLALSPTLACSRSSASDRAPLPRPEPGARKLPDARSSDAISPPSPSPAPTGDLAEHVAALRERFSPHGWTVLAEPPFAVVGDGSPSQVQAHAASTIRWAVEHLEAAYFEQPPDTTITIYLFETSRSYAEQAEALFGEPPDTPFGYYSPRDRALVMNIGTGGGTLVHEIVHPYMAANFRQCPNWFDEGLASLYEQSAELDGEIVGLTNWRLADLQTALEAGEVPSFEVLCNSGDGFYNADPGTNYAQARYLCYWLQQHGVLRDFYRAFRDAALRDPSGYATLSSFVGPDMDAFFARWAEYTLALRYG